MRSRLPLESLVQHELRRPLANLKSALLLLGRRHGEREIVDIAVRSVELLARLADDAVELALSAGLSLDLEPLDPGALARDAAAANGPRVRVALDAGLPLLQVDRRRISRALEALLANALRHAPAGTEVELTVLPRDAGVRFAVRDRGPGVAPEHREAIFTPFAALRLFDTRAGQGLGCGLALARALAERHGGTLTLALAADDGPGSTFVLWLPSVGAAVTPAPLR